MMFVTLFHGVLDLETGELSFVNAGHNPPLLVSGGEVTPLQRSGDPAIAVIEGFDFECMSARLTPGDVVFLYTDGVTEAFDPSGEQFGEPRLEQLVGSLRNRPVDEMAGAVRDAVLAFEAGAERADDLTCLTLAYRG
jgi:sigma-B regulation protein RsbU (phosphoserine phosphatase)